MILPLVQGDEAPAFELPDQTGRIHRLADYRGRWLIVYFYPKDGTPGCTRQACDLRDRNAELRTRGVEILGVSIDTPARHTRFATKHALPFPLLSDTTGAMAQRFGALWSWGPFKFARRHTYLIDPQGRIARIYRRVRAAHHANDLLRDLQSLQSTHKTGPL